ncbi:MAG: N-acetyl-gamma-glutamyl-phosphate reductase [Candidatus Adiutrix sp.]|jgi:N-acetyl-gamma-glutamyl-phosphate reductase|nr:N-acetyl-gamma-glutamyl-phosphate reductase [Candidatus Adiutrix sp.]
MQVGLIGATGYTGLELLRLLAQHPRRPEVAVITSRQEAGRALTEVFPGLAGLANYDRLIFEAPAAEAPAGRAEVFFLAAPHGVALSLAPALLAGGAKVIDLSADFRLKSPAVFEQWYQPHTAPDLLPEAVYGLPEIRAEALARARLVANPGCYPTSAILGLAPLVRAGLLAEDRPVIIDAASGVTGSGRGALLGNSFCEVAEGFKAYKVTGHRHIPEMEQELSALGGRPLTVAFTPHLAPFNRGILSTIYARPRGGVPAAGDLLGLYLDFYRAAPFVRVRPSGFEPRTVEVRGTNFCDLALFPDPRSGLIKIISVIDNLCRGASGQALANFNLINGWAETEGLTLAPLN